MSDRSAHPEQPKRRSLFSLLGDVPGLVSELVRGEIELLKAELAQKLKAAGIGVGLIVGAALIALLAIGVLFTVIILALSLVMPGWLAALIVLAVLLAVGGLLAGLGVRELKKGMPPMPERALGGIGKDWETIRGLGKRGSS